MRTAMMAITTSNSISVKPSLFGENRIFEPLFVEEIVGLIGGFVLTSIPFETPE